MFGPGTVPLLAAGSSHALPLPCLADWESYGLNLGQSSTHLEQGSGEGQIFPGTSVTVHLAVTC